MGYYIACDYDEPDCHSYRGILVIDTLTNQVVHRFFSGDFNSDYYEYQSWLEDTEPLYLEGDSILNYFGDLHDPAFNNEDLLH